MNIERKKQIILCVVAITLIGIGYMNHVKENSNLISVEYEIDDNNIGDVKLVNSDSLIMEENVVENVIVNQENFQNEVEVENDYYTKTKLERDIMFSEMLETYNEIINNAEVSDVQKSIAIQEIKNINDQKNGIMVTENLIKNKGYEDVVVLINNDTVTAVVKKEMLYDIDIVKIQNIIEEKLGYTAEKITITNFD